MLELLEEEEEEREDIMFCDSHSKFCHSVNLPVSRALRLKPLTGTALTIFWTFLDETFALDEEEEEATRTALPLAEIDLFLAAAEAFRA